MRWFIAAAVVCALAIWVQIELINKSAPVPVVTEPKAAEAPLTAPKETAIVPPSPAPAPAAPPAASPPKEIAQGGAPEQQPVSSTMSAVAVAPEPEAQSERLAPAIQTELRRLGCYNGETGGEWDRATRRALRRFARHAGVEINDGAPAASMLTMLRGYETNRECKAVALRTQPGATAASGGDAPARDDGYLPPWMRAQGQTGATQPAAAPGAEGMTGGGGQDAPVADNAAKPPEKKRRRHSSDPFTAIGRALGID